jgi:hypothetical protein
MPLLYLQFCKSLHFTFHIHAESNCESLFHVLFSGNFAIQRDELNRVFIDRDGRHFIYILNYLRASGNVEKCVFPWENPLTLRELELEAEYYNLSALKELIQIKSNGIARQKYLANAVHVSYPKVYASHHWEDNVPQNLLDNKNGKGWNSGGHAPQWIEYDFGESIPIASIALLVDQLPNGRTHHIITGGDDPNPRQVLNELIGHTEAHQVLRAHLNTNVRYLRVATRSSPSWVAWAKIDIKQNL